MSNLTETNIIYGLLEIDDCLKLISPLFVEERFVKLKSATLLTKWCLDELLKVSSLREQHHNEILDQIGDLAIAHRKIVDQVNKHYSESPIFRNFEQVIYAELNSLNEYFKLFVCKLKTIQLDSEFRRTRRYPRRNRLAAGATPEAKQGVCPWAPVKKPQEQSIEVQVSGINLFPEDEEEHEDDPYELSIFKSRGEISRRGDESFPVDEVADHEFPRRPIPFKYTPEYMSFTQTVHRDIQNLLRINGDNRFEQPTKLTEQCIALKKIYGYLLENRDFIASNQHFKNKAVTVNSKFDGSFIDLIIDRCRDNSKQLEDIYDAFRAKTSRVDPAVRKLKNETLAAIHKVKLAMEAIVQ